MWCSISWRQAFADMTIKPHALKKGDQIALVSPASRPHSAEALARAEAVVEKMASSQLLPNTHFL